MKFVLRPKTSLKLPKHAESTLRGAWGGALYELSCMNKEVNCKECRLRNQCVYFNIFTPRLSEKEKLYTSNRFKNKIRPYIIKSLADKKMYKAGEEIEFELSIFGSMIRYIPFVIQSWANLGENGMGAGKGKFELKEVWQVDDIKGESKRIYDKFDTNIEMEDELKMKCKDIKKKYNKCKQNIFTIDYNAPTLLIVDDKKIKNITFYDFMRNLFRRLSGLSKLYGEKLEVNFKQMLEKAKEIEVIEDETKWIKWERYSNNQEKSIEMQGAKGQVVYKGNIEKFLPYLKMGEHTGIGKNTVFGLGNYEVF